MSAPLARPFRLLGGTTEVTRVYHLIGAVAAAAVGLVLYAGERLGGQGGLLAAVVVVQVLMCATWTFGTASFGFPGTPLVALAAGIGADLVLREATTLRLGALGLVFAIAVLAAFVQQILRRPPRREVTVSLAQTVVAALAAESLALLLVLGRIDTARVVVSAALLCAGAAVVVAHLVDAVVAVPRLSPDLRRGALGVVLGVAAGAAVAADRLQSTALSDLLGHVIVGCVVAAATVLVSVAITFVVADRGPDRVGATVLQATVPYAVVAPVAVYVFLAVTG